MPHLNETEYWVYRVADQSLVGNLVVTHLQDEFMDVSISVCSGTLTHAKSAEIDRLFRGEYVLKHPGKEEFFGDYASTDEVCDAVKAHVEGPYYLTEEPVLPVVE